MQLLKIAFVQKMFIVLKNSSALHSQLVILLEAFVKISRRTNSWLGGLKHDSIDMGIYDNYCCSSTSWRGPPQKSTYIFLNKLLVDLLDILRPTLIS